jgi:hypothetical protein
MNRSNNSNLLNDDEVASFIISGYHIVEPDLPQGYNDEICDSLRKIPENPGERIVEALPKISVVMEHPSVIGALTSLLGPGFFKDPGGHIHMNPPKTRAQPWHQDERFGRGHQDRDIDHIKHVMLMYYPQDVTEDMGPTVLLPGSQRRVAAPETMVTLVNLKGQVFSTVSAGSVLLTHYDIWHAGTGNRSDRVRYMFKFLYSRTQENTEPSWDHDAGNIPEVRLRLDNEHPSTLSRNEYGTDHDLRVRTWNHIAGKAAMPLRSEGHLGGPWPESGGATTASRNKRFKPPS